MLQTLRSDNLVLSSGNSCVVASRVAFTEDLNLSGDQEEADTNIILPCANVLHRNYGENVRIWFPSGDTDILVLAVGLLQEFNDQGFILNRSGSTSSVILKLPLKVQLLLWISMRLCVVVFQETKTKMLEVVEKELKV